MTTPTEISLLTPAELLEARADLPSEAAEAARSLFIDLGLCEPVEGYPSLLDFRDGSLALVDRDSSLVFITREGERLS